MDYVDLQEQMVREQILWRGIKNKSLIDSMLQVPRHLFIPEDLRDYAYEDGPQPIGEGQTISQPYIVAYMIEIASISQNSRVLDVGTGSGYVAAILSNMVKEVFTIERIPILADTAKKRLQDIGYANIKFKIGDGSEGWLEHDPYDSIFVGAAAEKVPEHLKQQLAIGGTLIIPVGSPFGIQNLLRIQRNNENEWNEENVETVRFVPLI